MHNTKAQPQSGQTFIEFVLLLAVMFTITIAVMRGFNFGVAAYWENYIQLIAYPSESNITIPR